MMKTIPSTLAHGLREKEGIPQRNPLYDMIRRVPGSGKEGTDMVPGLPPQHLDHDRSMSDW